MKLDLTDREWPEDFIPPLFRISQNLICSRCEHGFSGYYKRTICHSCGTRDSMQALSIAHPPYGAVCSARDEFYDRDDDYRRQDEESRKNISNHDKQPDDDYNDPRHGQADDINRSR